MRGSAAAHPLHEEERNRLDAVHEFTMTIGNTTSGLLMWESLVLRAHFGTTCSNLAPGHSAFTITGFGPQEVGEAAPGVAAVQAVGQLGKPKASSVAGKSPYAEAELHAFGTKKRTYPPCARCELLGDKQKIAHTHSVDYCFANPLSKQCIQKVAWNRMQDLKELASKQPLPEWAVPILEAGEKLEDPNARGESKPKGEAQVSKKA